MDGLLLVLSALLLSRPLGKVSSRRLRKGLAAYLALMLCYGIGNIANDFWIEQVFKRHWTSWQIPNVLEPRPTIAWAVILVATAAILTRRHTPPAATFLACAEAEGVRCEHEYDD